jgi:hypothetical protein
VNMVCRWFCWQKKKKKNKMLNVDFKINFNILDHLTLLFSGANFFLNSEHMIW